MQLTTRLGLKLYQLLRGAVAAAGGSTLLNDLEHYWSLDEQSGTRADLVGSADLTDNNTVGAVNRGPLGTVAQFTAANSERLSTSAIIDGIVPASSLSVSFWTKLSDNDFCVWLRQGTTGGTTEGFSAYYESPSIAFSLTDGTHENRANFSRAGLAGDWHHITYIWDKDASTNGTSTIYLDGVAGTPIELSYLPSITNTGFNVGAWQSGIMGIDGNMSRVSIHSRAITSGEIASFFNAGNGKSYADLTTAEKVNLVAYYDLSEASGTRSNTANPGTLDLTDNNTVGSATSTVGAMDGAAASFVAASNESLSKASFTLTADYTVAAWFKCSASPTQDYPTVVDLTDSWPNSSQISAYVHVPSGGTFRSYIGDGTGNVGVTTSGYDYRDGLWHLAVLMYDSSTKKLSLSVDNASALVSDALSSARYSTAQTLYLGDASSTIQNFDGQIDEVAIWSRVLTSDERTELFNLGAGKFYDFS